MATELQNIKALEDELKAAQSIEVGILSNDGRKPIQNIINTYAVTTSIYKDPKALKELIGLLKAVISGYMDSSYKQGRLLGKNALEKFLEDSERADIIQSELRKIRSLSSSQAKARLAIAYKEIEKNGNILKSDIELFKMRSKLAGINERNQLMELVRIGNDKSGEVQAFANRMKRVAVDAMRRERSAAKIDQYLLSYPPESKWQWISISANPCPECTSRAGKVMTYLDFVKIGLPGSGRTICKEKCLCDLIPLPIAEDKFPTVKSFNWKPKDMVIATSREIKILLNAETAK